jgi:predicted acylesterase/phospholipase RssA/CRP-like cAMP-binding protein
MSHDGTGTERDLQSLRQALAPLFGELSDDAIHEVVASGTRVKVRAGQRLIRHGDRADSLYLLVRGRLRASVPDGEREPRVVGEVSQGEAVGEMALLGGERRNADIDAIRDSRLLRLDVEAFHDLTSRHPEFLWNLSRLVVRRMSRSPAAGRGVSPVRVIAVACVASDDMRDRFLARLAAALERHGHTTVIDRDSSRSVADERPEGWAEWLDRQEARHRFVLAVVDPAREDWSAFLVRQADRLLVVCPATLDPKSPDLERWTAADGAGAVPVRRDLVLLHAADKPIPVGTARWLDEHAFTRAHHVRAGRTSDFERLGRFLAGRAVGLVFAGGGAKGLTHVGIVRALLEERVPIDLVGGTSIGAILAASVAFDWDEDTRVANLRTAFVANNPASDYQIPPVVSLIRGKRMERLLQSFLGDTDVEDLWLPFFCVTSNLTASEKAVHSRGRLWKLLRASASIPGVFPPVVIGQQLHVDGGTFDNLPVATARELDAGHVIACDIRRSTHARVGYETVPSGGTVLLDRVLRRRRYRVPGLITTMMQATFLAGLERARTAAADADLFVESNASRISFLDWSALDRAMELGYAQARETFSDPAVRGRLEAIRRPARERDG